MYVMAVAAELCFVPGKICTGGTIASSFKHLAEPLHFVMNLEPFSGSSNRKCDAKQHAKLMLKSDTI